jgi:hypothetical protein
MLDQCFAGWSDRVEYWDVHDVDGATPDVALKEIEELVGELVRTLNRDSSGPLSPVLGGEG